jgi:hypothetical protein
MGALFKAAIVLWIAVFVVLYFWRMILWQQMINHAKSPSERLTGVRGATSLTDPEQYTEIGNMYRLKTMKVGQAMIMGHSIGIPIALWIASKL